MGEAKAHEASTPNDKMGFIDHLFVLEKLKSLGILGTK